MLESLSQALVLLDRIAGQFAAALHDFEPQIYGLIVLAALIWFGFPKDDLDQA